MKVALIYGGKSGEHEVSLRSAASVAANLSPVHRIVPIGITQAGAWILQPDSVVEDVRAGSPSMELREQGPELLVAPGGGLRAYGTHGASQLAVDLAFPVLHGSFGEDGTVQGLLECAGIAYVGADVLGSALGMDKEYAKRLWMERGLSVVPFMAIQAADKAHLAELRDEAAARFGWPLFVKPARTGSSVGAAKVSGPAQWDALVADAFRYDTKALVEPFMRARELECSVIGNAVPRAFDPGEVAPSHEFYDYEAKYIDPDGAKLFIPAPVERSVLDRVKAIAMEAYTALGLVGMARVDFFWDANGGKLYLNEVNTIPGFTSISMFPKMCEAGGLGYGALLDELMRLALERHAEREAILFKRA